MNHDETMIDQIAQRAAVKTGVLGFVTTTGTFIASLKAATVVMQFVSATAAAIVGVYTLWQLFRNHRAKKQNKIGPKLFVIAMVFGLCSGCTGFKRALDRTGKKIDANEAALKEVSRELTTGGVDTLSLAPTNKHTELALKLAKLDQQIEGVPQKRIDVPAILAGERKATSDLEARFRQIDVLVAEKLNLESKNRELEERLQDLGAKYEAERNTGIVKRIKRALFATLGLGGVIALCVFFPAVIPIFTRLAVWIVSMVPKLGSILGIASQKVVKNIIDGIEEAKTEIPAEATQILHKKLSQRLDAQQKAAVRTWKTSKT